MRISDWSSDVCSSDLGYHPKAAPGDDYGPAIAVNGVIPDWLRDTDVGLFENTPDNWLGGDGKTLLWWVWGGKGHCPISIRLPADHPYYLLQRNNHAPGTALFHRPARAYPPADGDGGPS